MPTKFEINQHKFSKDHGEIVLYQRSDHKKPFWQTRITLDGNSRLIRKSTRKRDFADAKRVATEIYESVSEKFRKTGSVDLRSFEQVVDEWLDAQEAQDRDQSTLKEFRERLHRYAVRFWRETYIDHITPADLEAYLDWRKSSSIRGNKPAPATIRKELVPLKQVFKYAYGKKYTSEHLQFPNLRVASKRRPAFTEKEWRTLVRKLDPWLRAANKHDHHYRGRFYLKYFVLLLGYSGIRPGTEARSLTWRSIAREKLIGHEGHNLVITVPHGKRGSRSLIPDKKVEGWLDELRSFRYEELKSNNEELLESEPIFCHRDGTPIHSFKKGFEAFLKNYGLLKTLSGERRTPYSLRHTYATRMILEGVSHWDLAKNMGTSVEQLEKFYVHDNPALYGGRLAKFSVPSMASGGPRHVAEKSNSKKRDKRQ